MAVSNQDIINFLLANPGMSDADIGAAMAQYGVSPAQMAQATGLSEGEVTSRLAATLAPNQATLFGDTYVQPIYTQLGSGMDAQQGPLENVVTYKATDNKTGGNVNWYDPTGQYQQTTQQQKVPSFLGGLADVANDPFVQAALLAGGAGGALGNALGLTGTTANAVGTGLLKAGTAAAGGADIGDALKAGLLSGGLVYGSGLLSNMDTPVDFNNMTADQIDEALQSNLVKDLKNAGVTNPSEFLTGQGGNAATYIQESVAASDLANNLANQGLNSGEIAQLLESVGVAPTAIADALDNLPLNASTGGLLSSVATTPITDAVNVTGQAPTTVPTAVIPSAVTTPTTSAGTVNVTGTAQPQQIDQSVINLINSQLAANVGTPANLANVQVTADKGLMSNTDTTSAILNTIAGLPSTPATPTTTNNVANVEVTADKGLMSGDTTATDIANVLAGLPVTPAVTTPSVTTTPTQTITAEKPVTTQEATNIITSLLPTITPTQAATVAEQIVTSDRPVTKEDVVSAITSVIPSIATPVVSTPTVKTPEVTPEVKITTPKTPTLSDVVAPIAAVTPAVVQTPVTTPTTSVPTQTIIAEKPTTINDVVTPATIPLIQPSTPLTPTPVTSSNTNSLGLTDAQMLNLLKAGIGLFGTVGATSALSGGGTSRGVGALPTQGMPLYSTDYFNQIQQNYNNLLPAVPRDVASPLRDWYLSQYGA